MKLYIPTCGDRICLDKDRKIMKSIIYYRKSLTDDNELRAINKYFKSTHLLEGINGNILTISRYSLYPFIRDQIEEIKARGGTPINSLQQHSYISDCKNYITDIRIPQ